MKQIFITNDDGIEAQGIQTLALLMSRIGEVTVVAPDSARSGAACSITPTRPVEVAEWKGRYHAPDGVAMPEPGPFPIHYYTCSGTPVDCVKIAYEHVLTCKPDLMVSGINHGDNASCSVHYSGTMGAVIEGCLKGWQSIGFSLRTLKKTANFEPFFESIVNISEYIINHPLPIDQCINVNYPEVDKLAGTKVTRMARGEWSGEWADAKNPHGKRAFWLTGHFTNLEPEDSSTDCWALENGYASVTPIQLDVTAYDTLQMLKYLEE